MEFENTSTIEKKDLKEKAYKKQKKKNNSMKFYRSFLTIVLLVLILQIGYSAILNVSKSIAYKSKINKSNELLKDAKEQNEYLKQKLRTKNPMEQVEYIARNNLKMVADNEILIIINENTEEDTVPKTFKDKFLQFVNNSFNK